MYINQEELMKYINLLLKVSESGFDCSQEMSDALNALHSMMKPPTDKEEVYVFEEGLDKANRTLEMFENILAGKIKSKTRGLYSRTLSTGSANIYILFNVDDIDPSFFRGKRATYIINNTNDKNLDTLIPLKG